MGKWGSNFAKCSVAQRFFIISEPFFEVCKAVGKKAIGFAFAEAYAFSRPGTWGYSRGWEEFPTIFKFLNIADRETAFPDPPHNTCTGGACALQNM